MNKTLYISDLDGTLLNSSSLVSETSRHMLNHLIEEQGILFSIATARTPATVARLMEGIACKLPLIVMTGAAMWTPAGLTNTHFLKTKDVKTILHLTSKAGIQPFFYTLNGTRIEAWHHPEVNDYDHDFMMQRCHTVHKRFILSPELDEQRMKLTMLVFAAADYDLMGNVFQQVKTQTDCSITYYRDIFNNNIGFLEAMGNGVSKAKAVAQLKEQCKAERVVVFGDSPNDLSMRTVADVFVAPENASPEVLRVADEVTLTNNDDCVAHWINNDVKRQSKR